MESIFLLILVFLAILAAVDLFVGVSNDAVNFLNSAIGSRIASFKVIMVVASIGVLLGSTFSSGMMEIARSGVFNPEMFTFNEIIIIFFAVMITDVLLLDAFNSMGLPTSTTVSIVFELLGGAVAAASSRSPPRTSCSPSWGTSSTARRPWPSCPASSSPWWWPSWPVWWCSISPA